MTLNISVVGKNAIFQSSDFRLSAFELNPDGTYRVTEDNSPKIVSLQYKEWAGYVTYCGIGKYGGVPTYKQCSDWISSLGVSPTFNDIVSKIEQEGSTWIKGILRALGEFRSHSFIVGAYENGSPRLAIISNSHSACGSISRDAQLGLQATFGLVSKRAVYVTGIDNAVLREERAGLRKLADRSLDQRVIREQLARINSAAAARVQAANGISAHCMTCVLEANGGTNFEVHGQVGAAFSPVVIRDGIDFGAEIGRLFGANHQFVQMVSATAASSDAVAEKRFDCVLSLDPPHANFTGHELGGMNEMHISFVSANDKLTAVGQIMRPLSGAPHALVYKIDGEIIDLGVLPGGLTSQASDINSDGLVVGSATLGNGDRRAFFWSGGGELECIEPIQWNNSHAAAVNSVGQVVGCIFKSPSMPGAGEKRAFIWSRERGMELIPGLESAYSDARDLNDRGEVLGICDLGNGTQSFVWSVRNGIEILTTPWGSVFHASAINNLGTVIGEADDQTGIRKGIVWDKKDGTRRLPILFGFSPIDIDDYGNIAGHDHTRPWSSAWVVTAAGELFELPAGRDHAVNARAIVGDTVFGHASTSDWKHWHPIRWERKR